MVAAMQDKVMSNDISRVDGLTETERQLEKTFDLEQVRAKQCYSIAVFTWKGETPASMEAKWQSHVEEHTSNSVIIMHMNRFIDHGQFLFCLIAYK